MRMTRMGRHHYSCHSCSFVDWCRVICFLPVPILYRLPPLSPPVPPRSRLLRFLLQFFLHFSSVAMEFARRGKLSQPMPHHLFRNQNFNMFLPVMYAKCKSHHFRRNLTCARPCLNNTGFSRFFPCNFLHHPFVNVRAFF